MMLVEASRWCCVELSLSTRRGTLRYGARRSVIEHEMKSIQMRCVSRDKHKDRETEMVRVEVTLSTRRGARSDRRRVVKNEARNAEMWY